MAHAAPSTSGARLPVLGVAPEIRGTQRWFNTPGGRPLSLESLRGGVVLLDFWTYSCINCLRTLPELRAWDRTYRRAGLTIIGLHAPEFTFERGAGNVQRAIARNRLRYPVAQDNDFATWNAYGNRFWPAKYLIDSRGRVRYTHFGEGAYDTIERAIRSLLVEAGRRRLGHRARASRAGWPARRRSPTSAPSARNASSMGGLNPVGGTSRCHATCWPRSPPTISPTTAAGESIGRSQPQTRTARGCTFASSRAGSSLCWALASAAPARGRRRRPVAAHRDRGAASALRARPPCPTRRLPADADVPARHRGLCLHLRLAR